MARIPHCQKGEEIENQIIDISTRVKDVRPALMHVCRDLLINPALLGNPFLHRILSAAAWVSGEYVEFSRNPFELMEALLQPRTNLLPPSIRAVYVQSAFKALIFCIHFYLLHKKNISSFSPDNLTSEVPELVSVSKSSESSDLATSEYPGFCEQHDSFNLRNINKSFKDLSIENSGDATVSNGQASTSTSLGRNSFAQESIVNLFDIVELALGPLSGSHDVEIQERVRNVLGFTDLVKQEILNPLVLGEENLERDVTEASCVVKLTCDAFSEELGPVSTSVQERVPVPDGLLLEENLADLEIICGDIQLPLSSSFSLTSTRYGETVGISQTNIQSKDETEPSNESTSLLAEHRKRHGLYYLPSVKGEVVSNDYPPANDPMSQDKPNDDAEDLLKLTGQSLVPKKMPNQAKLRPVVLKLDGDKISIAAKKPELKADLLSGVVRDVLLGEAAVPRSSRSNHSENPSGKSKGKEKLNADISLQSKENLQGEEMPDHVKTSSRSKHRSHGKERRQRSLGKDGEEKEDNGQKEKRKSNHRHGKHKARQRAEEPLNVVAQTPVVPDFLL